jgi:WD40 repeat protein
MLASGSYDKIIIIWSLKTFKKIKKLEGHTSQVNSVCISPDNNRIVSGSFDRRIIIWDLNTSNRLKII